MSSFTAKNISDICPLKSAEERITYPGQGSTANVSLVGVVSLLVVDEQVPDEHPFTAVSR